MSYPPYSGYPPQQNAPMQYPPQQQVMRQPNLGFEGVTPYGGGYPGASNYPPASGGGYPPQQQPYGGQPPAPGFNAGGGGGYPAPQQQPSYPQQPGGGYPPQNYPAQQQPGQYPGAGGGYPGGSAYPSQQPTGYPASQPSAYPAHQSATGGYPSSGGYPSQQQPAGYPAQSAGYPSQQPAGYPSQQPAGYPSQQPAGYPSQQPAGYPAPQQQHGGYPGVQPASGYPSQQPHGGGYPAQQSGAAGYPTSQPSGYGAGYPNISGGAAPGGHGGGYPGGQQQVILTPVMSAMTPFEGTVRPAPNFNPNQDAEALKKAMKGIGCDDKAIINVLCYRTNAQRQQIRLMFKTMYGKDLVKELISELRGNFEDLIVALLYTQGEYDARELDHAMKGMGTVESTLIEIMVTRTNAEVQAIKEAFRRLFGRDLEQALSNETSGHFKRLLVSLTVGGRDESTHTDPSYAAQQAKQLYEAGEKQWGTNESAFNAIMVASNPNQLQLVFENYRKITGHDVEQAVKSEFSGDIEDGLLTVVKCAKNRPAYFAERAYQAMRGMGTHDRALIRVIVSRCEKDMVQIKQEYQRMYKTPLENAISGDCSGKYKEGLLALVKGR